MRAGVLIVGSLLWDPGSREDWRAARLKLDEKMNVPAPIRYGRRSPSRGKIFTISFGAARPGGKAVVVPLSAEVNDVAALMNEAEALWAAEQRAAPPHAISAEWGSIGLMFRDPAKSAALMTGWQRRFRSIAAPAAPVDDNGILDIAWPARLDNGEPVDLDLLLATATMAEPAPPTAVQIADALAAQKAGHERYFFQNVLHGIRTAEDGEIWQAIKKKAPAWLNADAYREARAILEAEMGAGPAPASGGAARRKTTVRR